MVQVKDICKNCGETRRYSTFEKIMVIINSLFSALGVIFLILLVMITPMKMFSSITSDLMIKYTINLDDDELRSLSLNMTEDCRNGLYNDVAFCYAEHIYNNLSSIDYSPASLYHPIQNPITTFLTQQGDCKNSALLFVGLMRNAGFEADMVCSGEYAHCVSIVRDYRGNTYYGRYAVIDLTIPAMYVMNHGEDVWDYRELGEQL